MPNVFAGGDPVFDANPRAIRWFMQQIEAKTIALPDFQRDFVWDPADVRDLLVSIMNRFPAGALLLLEQSSSHKLLKPRRFSGAPELEAEDDPQFLVLDGQQRLTSLWQAHSGEGDARYLVDLSTLVYGTEAVDVDSLDFDELVSFESVKTGKPIVSDDPAWQYENWKFPVHLFLTEGFDTWLNEAVDHHGGTEKERLDRRLRLASVRQTLLDPLGSYSFPTIALDRGTSLIAVCKIFETLNRSGIKLSVFELLTARVFAHGQDLRQLWSEARTNYPILDEFKVDPYKLLQAITLRSAASAQRSAVLDLTHDEIGEHWPSVVKGFAAALELIRDQCWVQTEKWLPYTAVVIPIAAIWNLVEGLSGPKVGNAKEQLKQYFWCSVFTTNFDQGANSQAQADYLALQSWLVDPRQPAPEAVADFEFSTSQLESARRNRRALYRGVMALAMHSGAVDFHTRDRITATKIASSEIDAHHIFPRNWLRQNYEVDSPHRLADDLILNFALIDSTTNKLISDNAPSTYLDEMQGGELGPDRDRVLRSHVILDGTRDAMLANNYEAFIRARAQDVADAIEAVTSKSVSRDTTD